MSDTFQIRRSTVAQLESLILVEGRVESVHDSSFNLRFGDTLWNANTRRDAIHPQGILVSEEILPGIQIEMPSRLSPALLEIGPIQLEAAAPLGETGRSTRVNAMEISVNITRLERLLRLFGRPSIVRATMIEDADHETATRVARLINEGVSLYDWLSFIGGGEGSTPAWDDFLTGVVLADRLLGGRRFDGGLPESLRNRTTELSALQFEWALGGQSSLVIEEFLAALTSRRIGARLLARCFSLGHSSGSDIVTGVHAALATWCGARSTLKHQR